MNLEQHVPILVITAVLVKSVPPVPIAAFSDVERFPSRRKTGVVGVRGLEFNEGLTSLHQALPGEALFLFTRPRTQGTVDPRTCTDGLDFGQVGSLGQEFGWCGRHDGRVVGQTTVPFGHERASVVVVLELGHEHPVLPVQRYGQEVFRGVFAGIEELLSNVIEVGDEVRNGGLRRHRAVLEGDAVGNDPVSEDDGDFAALRTGDRPRRGQVGSVLDIDQVPVGVGGLLEDLFVGDHPLDAHVGHRLDHGG